MNLFHEFSGLPHSATGNCFPAIQLPGKRNDFLARGTDGSPVFLLNDASRPQYFPSVHYKYLKAQYHTTCKVTADGRDLEGQFAMVVCDGTAFELHEIFVRCFAAAIEELPEDCGTRELSGSIQSLLDLFRSLGNTDGKAVTGLWAELYVIANSGQVTEALTAWHSDPYERFDFFWENSCLEVKASTGLTRLHHFALEQLMEPNNGCGYVASLLLQPLSGGYGVLDLANIIDGAICRSPGLRHKLWHNLALCLGDGYSSKLDKHFDVSFAERSIKLYRMIDVPRPPFPTDPRISALKFCADLTTLNSSLENQSLAKFF